MKDERRTSQPHFFSRLKSMFRAVMRKLFPPSAESFYSEMSKIDITYARIEQMEQTLQHSINQLQNMIDANSAKILEANETTKSSLFEQGNNLSTKGDIIYAHITNVHNASENMFWLLMAKPGEDRQQTTRRVFLEMAEDRGSVGDVQVICYDIMKFYHKFCEDHHLQYFLFGGTMIGAVRHKGFIPWDDDADVIMVREDYEKFRKLIKQDSSGYELIDYYECGIAPYRCGRFSKLSRTDDPAHVFIDVFVLDHDCCRNNEESVERYPHLREVLQQRIWETCMRHGISSSNSPIKDENQKRIIDEVFDDFLREVSTPEGENYQWGWEQFLSPLPVFIDKKELFPLQLVPFKDSYFYIPFDAESILRARYGNIYSIPTDMYADFHSNVFGYVDNRSIIHELAERLRREEALSDF